MIKLEKDLQVLTTYLQAQKWLLAGEHITHFHVPGDGNMNFTLRICTPRRSFIIKQSRGYVEKYPQVAAPTDRVQREADFYKEISDHPYLTKMTPKIMGVDGINNIIAMEDLGAGKDYTFFYKNKAVIPDTELQQIMKFAAVLHNENKIQNATSPISNRAMRKLNHEHMFLYPYLEDNGLNLDTVLPGLADLAKKYKDDTALKAKIESLGNRYLEDGDTLLHGDYFPGSWLKTEEGVRIIDPEFCFYGYPEFEIGVTTAHLMLCDQPVQTILNAHKYYKEEADLDLELVKQCAGAEVLRRILGLAQLPLSIDLEKRAQLLETAREYVMNNNN
ncbi:phosphotransferase [Portibacter marinus]|uniref:phosphotransferase n=1 Tax=Portibacter marinus TaxID=2898660 RepID=UPI001F19BD70|nr:phosphotransferase [Portibacter marinus]